MDIQFSCDAIWVCRICSCPLLSPTWNHLDKYIVLISSSFDPVGPGKPAFRGDGPICLLGNDVANVIIRDVAKPRTKENSWETVKVFDLPHLPAFKVIEPSDSEGARLRTCTQLVAHRALFHISHRYGKTGAEFSNFPTNFSESLNLTMAESASLWSCSMDHGKQH